jgi:hypothetical protein
MGRRPSPTALTALQSASKVAPQPEDPLQLQPDGRCDRGRSVRLVAAAPAGRVVGCEEWRDVEGGADERERVWGDRGHWWWSVPGALLVSGVSFAASGGPAWPS